MAIEPNFIFSANSLQDYLDCPRRFELKYILKQSWPAAMSEPVLEFEHHLQLGSRFHQLAYQFLNGVPQENLVKTIEDPDLKTWFQNLLTYMKSINFQSTFSELSVKIPIGAYQAIAVFDLLALTKEGQLLILDWKTAKRIPRKNRLADRIQTLLYPYAAFESAPAILSEFAHKAENLQMTYLFVRHNRENAITFEYGHERHEHNGKSLENLIAEICVKEPGSFERTSENRKCKFCNYRSLCERGIQAGDFHQEEDEIDLDQVIEHLDFSTQDEIAF